MKDTHERKNTDAMLSTARARWTAIMTDTDERENRVRGRMDAAFAAGDQWDEADLQQRRLSKRPALVVNRMPAFLHQVENEVRQNRISIKLSPVDSGIDKDIAAVDQGLVRAIQYNSQADTAVHGAFVESCRTALGAFELRSRYVDAYSFDQELYIEQVPNAIDRAYWDPASQKPDRSDAQYFFVVDTMSHDEFRQEFPQAEACVSNFWDGGFGNFDHDWISEIGVRVARYYYLDAQQKTLLGLNDGATVLKENVGELPEGVEVVTERKTVVKMWRCALINGVEVLDEWEWPGITPPVFVVLGEETYSDGKRVRHSLIHWAKDAQRLYNFYRSTEAEVIGQTPKAPYIGVEGQFEGHEEVWSTANQIPYAYLEYKPTSISGQPAPPPQRNTYEPPIIALSRGAAESSDDMKATLGMYDASLGARSNETSGKAIQARQAEGDLANFHFIDNLARAIEACGRAIVEVKRYFYDTPQTIQILGEDEKQKVVRINEQYVDEDGRDRLYTLDAKYNVTVSTGPSYTSQRQEAYAQMTEFVRSAPDLLKIMGDVLFRNSDMPGADQIADRLEKTLPPELQDDDAAEQVPPQVQAQMQQLAQEADTAKQQAAALAEQVAELQRKTDLEHTKIAINAALKIMEIDSREGMVVLREQLAHLNAQRANQSAEAPMGEQPDLPIAA